jgi:hypothetical protein
VPPRSAGRTDRPIRSIRLITRCSCTVVAVAGGVLLVVILTALTVYFRRHLKRLERKAEQAYPGPLPAAGLTSHAY